MNEMVRFWSKVDRQDDHWIWCGAKVSNKQSTKKYGHFYSGSKMIPAHRFSYELVNGPVPEGHTLDHICHVTLCVNPDHLQLATPKQQAENRSGPRRDSKSGVRGVYWRESRKRWIVQVTHNYKNHHVGEFRTLEEAAIAARNKRIELFTNSLRDRDDH